MIKLLKMSQLMGHTQAAVASSKYKKKETSWTFNPLLSGKENKRWNTLSSIAWNWPLHLFTYTSNSNLPELVQEVLTIWDFSILMFVFRNSLFFLIHYIYSLQLFGVCKILALLNILLFPGWSLASLHSTLSLVCVVCTSDVCVRVCLLACRAA